MESRDKLGSHFLSQGNVGLDYALSRRVALKLGFDFSHFALGHSTADHFGRSGTGFEPDSVTNEGVAQLGRRGLTKLRGLGSRVRSLGEEQV